MKRNKFATIQIDVDGLWVIFQHFGIEKYNQDDILYNIAVPRFLDLFDSYKLKATLFVVGHDLLDPTRAAFLKQAVRRGHEIANHSMSHAEGFSFKSRNDKIKEIAEAEKIIESTLGVRPYGFRTPSNDVDEETLDILESRGYLYDSSVIPTFWGPLLKRIKFAKLKVDRTDNYLGKWHYGLCPLSPYHPSPKALHKKGSMKLWEVPITTMPLFRFPFHTSFVMATMHFGLNTFLFDLGYFLLQLFDVPYNFVFHTNELADPIENDQLKRQFGLSIPIKKKKALCHHVLAKIAKNYSFITTQKLVEHYSKLK